MAAAYVFYFDTPGQAGYYAVLSDNVADTQATGPTRGFNGTSGFFESYITSDIPLYAVALIEQSPGEYRGDVPSAAQAGWQIAFVYQQDVDSNGPTVIDLALGVSQPAAPITNPLVVPTFRDPIYQWVLNVLRATESEIPKASIYPFINTPLYRLLNLYPEVMDQAGADLSGLNAVDLGQLQEAVGYITAARWICLPKTDEDRIIIRAKIGELEAVYQQQLPEQFAYIFMLEGFQAFYQLSIMVPIVRGLRAQYGMGTSVIVSVNPTRQMAKDHPEIAGPLNNLFAPRESMFVSPFAYPPTFSWLGGQFPVWGFPADWRGWLVP